MAIEEMVSSCFVTIIISDGGGFVVQGIAFPLTRLATAANTATITGVLIDTARQIFCFHRRERTLHQNNEKVTWNDEADAMQCN